MELSAAKIKILVTFWSHHVYTNKFQLQSSKKKKWFMTKKMFKTLDKSLKRMNMGSCEFNQNIRYETAMSDLQLMNWDL